MKQKKPEATLREMLKNGSDQAREQSNATTLVPGEQGMGLPFPAQERWGTHMYSARYVSLHLIFLDMVQKQPCYFSETCNKERPASLTVQNLGF